MIFQETQSLATNRKVRWLLIVLLLFVNALLLIWGSDEGTVNYGLLITNCLLVPILALLFLFKMEILITDEHLLLIKLSVWLPVKTYRYQLDGSHDISYTTIRPIRDFGGWGYRVTLRGEVGLIVKGSKAVKIDKLYFTIVDVKGFQNAVKDSTGES